MDGLLRAVAFRVARHWIAGETAEDALRRAKEANVRKIAAIVNLLGEDVELMEHVVSTTTEYMDVLRAIRKEGLQSSISVKPTQLGLNLDENVCRENLERIVDEAKSLGNFVWIDMEGSRFTQSTIDLYLHLLGRYQSVGVAIQAYLKRSEGDVERLLTCGGKIRLCKGAYNEPPTIALRKKDEINQNFSKLMRIMFDKGRGFAIATHDDKLIDEAVELSRSYHEDFEFQMLMGIRDGLKLELAEQGHRVSEYIPYGRNWLPYSIRRIRERKRNILLLARSLISP